jgi:hypothetical protein
MCDAKPFVRRLEGVYAELWRKWLHRNEGIDGDVNEICEDSAAEVAPLPVESVELVSQDCGESTVDSGVRSGGEFCSDDGAGSAQSEFTSREERGGA